MKDLKVFLVGGAVRDRVMGFEPKDLDFVVVGSTPEQMLQLGFQQVGADFPVFLHPTTGNEFALARTERKVGSGYTGFEVDFDSDITLEQDLFRRDLTINALAIQVTGWNEDHSPILADTIIDFFGGVSDIEQKVLRPVSSHFMEDPVRVLRAARFLARFPDFKYSTDLVVLCNLLVRQGELLTLVPERVCVELEKVLSEKAPSRFFNFLQNIVDDTKSGLNMLFPDFHDILPSKLELALDRLVCIDNIEQRKTARFVALAIGLSEETVQRFCDHIKAPSHITNICMRVSRVVKLNNHMRVNTAEWLMTILETLDVLRSNQHHVQAISTALTFVPTFRLMLLGELIPEATDIIKEVGMKDCVEHKLGVTLLVANPPAPGPLIAKEIRSIRVSRLHQQFSDIFQI